MISHKDMIYLNFPELLSEKLGNWLYFYFFVKCILSDIWSFFYKLDKKDPKNEKGFLKRNRKKTMFKVLRLSILDNHELMLSLESTYLINPVKTSFYVSKLWLEVETLMNNFDLCTSELDWWSHFLNLLLLLKFWLTETMLKSSILVIGQELSVNQLSKHDCSQLL